jgi:hypothetical protein
MFRSLQNKLRQWVLSAPPLPPMKVPQSAVESRLQTLMDSRPTVLAWQIDNGFVLVHRDIHREETRIHYCADHQAIADHLVSTAAQKTLFPSSADLTNVKTAPSYRTGVIR